MRIFETSCLRKELLVVLFYIVAMFFHLLSMIASRACMEYIQHDILTLFRFRLLVSDERFCDMSYMPLYQMTNVKVIYYCYTSKKNVVHVILDNVTMSINF